MIASYIPLCRLGEKDLRSSVVWVLKDLQQLSTKTQEQKSFQDVKGKKKQS